MDIEIDANVCGKSSLYVVRQTKNRYLEPKKSFQFNYLI